MANDSNSKGVSLAKGPVAVIGLALLAYGVTGLILGGNGFTAEPVDGTVQGTRWLGLEANGWSNLLFAGAGALLLFGAPLHWGAKSLSLIVGLGLGAASVISLVDGDDAFGIFAANGLTKLVWGIAAAVLLVLALLPRVGRGKTETDEHERRARRETTREERRVRTDAREPDSARFDRDPRAPDDRSEVGSRVVAAAAGTTPESLETTRRQRENGEPESDRPGQNGSMASASREAVREAHLASRTMSAGSRSGPSRRALANACSADGDTTTVLPPSR
jgi:hypothetical protein